jgi:hypothetical protein
MIRNVALILAFAIFSALGARDERGFRRAIRLSLGWSLGFGLGVSAVFLVGGGLFIDFVTTSPDVPPTPGTTWSLQPSRLSGPPPSLSTASIRARPGPGPCGI